MLCRICGCNLSQISNNNCEDYCKSCGKCSKYKYNENMVKCPNCGYVNYIESNNISIIQRIKRKIK